MHNPLKDAFDAEKFRQQGHQLIDMLADHLNAVQHGNVRHGNAQHGNARHTNSRNGKTEQPVIPWHKPEDELAFWEQDLAKGQGDALDLFRTVISRSIHLHHNKYMGHQVVPPAPLGALASLLSSFLNNGSAVYEMGAVSNALERVVAQQLCQQIGWQEESGGILTSGGTLANLTALLTARRVKAQANVWGEGMGQKLALMVSAEAHYCVDRAARIMGWGSEGIIKIPVNDKFQMRTELLEEHLAKAKADGLEVVAVVGSACTTSTGAYDNLVEISGFCTKNDLWFHVDGAHGGAVIFSDKYRHLAKGINLADSVVIDMHKMLLAPALTTALLYRKEVDSYRTFAQQAQYLWSSQEDQEWYNMGKRTMECTKLMMSVKVYALIKTYGTSLFDEYVSRQYDLGKSFAELIKKRALFELGIEPSTNIVCFRYKAADVGEDKVDELNSHIRQALVEQGEFYIVQTRLNNKVYLRTTLMNSNTTEKELNELLNRIEELAQHAYGD